MSSGVLGGVAATRTSVIVADRDPADRVDIFRCFNPDGTERWTLRYPAPGKLDYGNSSRATPEIHGDLVYLCGAQGHLHAVELKTGKTRWKKHLQRDFGGPDNLSWGYCFSPLLTDGKLIIQPGGKEAALVALEPETGEILWKSGGRPPGHSSLVAATFGERKQVVGYDDESLGGWDQATGERLWSLKPDLPGDFNVPTPIVWGNKLIATSENNGVRIYGFDSNGIIVDKPLSSSETLAPDCHSPILAGSRLLGVSAGLFCLDATNGLAEVWKSDDKAFHDYASLIASADRALATTLSGRLILFRVRSSRFEKLDELQLFESESGLYSHPAIVGERLYIRGTGSLVCINLDGANELGRSE